MGKKLQISDRGDSGYSSFHFDPYFTEMAVFTPPSNFSFLSTIFGQKEDFVSFPTAKNFFFREGVAQLPFPPPPPRYDATLVLTEIVCCVSAADGSGDGANVGPSV